MFSNRDLRNLIVPLFVEQFLLLLVGLADTFVVSYAGEAAVSGVSLVNSFNTVFIFLFTALASGGAVIISQYIGRGDKPMAGRAASQLLMFSTVSSALCSSLILIFNRVLLRMLFGKVESDVMAACATYLRISAYSFPALAIYNAGAALCRSVNKTRVTMCISLVSNVVNIVGNLIGVFVLHAGVAGVAYPSLIARTLSAVAVTAICCGKHIAVSYQAKDVFHWEWPMLKRVLGVAVPNGVENGIQLQPVKPFIVETERVRMMSQRRKYNCFLLHSGNVLKTCLSLKGSQCRKDRHRGIQQEVIQNARKNIVGLHI